MFKVIDRILEGAAKASGWLCLILVLLTTEQVLARYFFNAASIGAQEMEWHLFGVIFLLAAAPALMRGEHVRVDIFYGKLSSEWQRRIDIAGHLLFLLPTAGVLIWYGVQSVLQARSYGISPASESGLLGWLLAGEASPDPGGLPARWIIKAFIPLSGLLLVLAAVRALMGPRSERSEGTSDGV